MSARAALALCLLIATAMPVGAIAAVDVVTERYDDARLGANLEETTLDTSNVDVDGFGKRWSYTVSGSVYAQPLFVHGVTISGSPHDVLYVATMNNQLYAFDADAADDTPLLQASLGTPIPILDILGFNDNIIGNVGIESTPVIDRATSTLYLVARTREMGGGCGGANPTFCQRLHALDLATLAEKPGSPVMIGGSVPGHGSGSVGGTLTFDPKIEDQRASLALSNGRVFIAWSSHSDQLPYHGWVMAYDATTLAQTMIWSSAPDGTPFNGAGIWMSGRAPAVDASGNVYYTTGNGTWDGVSNFGESFVKFGPTPDAPLLDWFTPSAVDLLNQIDLDLAGSGPILVPGTDRIVSAGKSGVFYVTRTGDMGHESADDVNIVQRFDNSRIAGDFEQIKGGPVYWNRAGGLGPWMYVWSDGCNHFNAYRFNGSTFDLPPISQSTALSPCGSSGGVLTLSANGSAAGSGIVWVSMPIAGDANSGVHAGVLRAYDADDLDHELWNSEQNPARDSAGNWPKFSPPTVVDGRVYLGSFPQDGVGSTKVNVYGLLAPAADFALSAAPPNPGAMPGTDVVYSVRAAAVNGFASPLHLDVAGLPDGASAEFADNDVVPPIATTLTIHAGRATALGQYVFTIRASGASIDHEVGEGLYMTDSAPGQGVIGVDFAGAADLPEVPILPAIDAAGVVAKPNWNVATGLAGSDLALLDESGAGTGASLDWTSEASATLALDPASGDAIMMDAFVDADATASEVAVANLPPNAGGYFVYVYADGDNGAQANTGTYRFEDEDGISSIDIVDAANATFDGTFVQSTGGAGNYAVFFTGGTAFTLMAMPAAGSTHAALNGIQIVRGNRIFANGFD